MDLAATCEVLKGTQLADGAARTAAEEKLDEASRNNPNELSLALSQVLAGGDNIAVELRQEAAVILRQLVIRTTRADSKDSPDWTLSAPAQSALKTQLLLSLEGDSSSKVRRNVGHTVAAIGDKVANDCDGLMAAWPELLPALSRYVSPDSPAVTRVAALSVLKDLARPIGDGLLAKDPAVAQMLRATLGDATPEVRSAGAQLVLQYVEDLEVDESAPLAPLMGDMVKVLQTLAKGGHEEQLKDTLTGLISAIEEEPDFFKDNCMQELWTTLVELCSAGASFADTDVRHNAMEAAVSLTVGLADELGGTDGQTLLEQLLALNFEWMLEVEQDVEAWTEAGKNDDDDDVDGDVVSLSEENFDRIAEKVTEDVFMPVLFKVIRAGKQVPGADWRHARAAVMAISQVIEHVEDEAWVDQCVEFIAQSLKHEHPRVRYASFWAIGQIAYDHDPYVQETFHGMLLPAIVIGIDDENPRVATSSVHAFTTVADDIDYAYLEPHVEEVLLRMFARLYQGGFKALQEQCLIGVAVVAEVAEEEFTPYYTHVMPALKQIISSATSENDRTLRGKAFECATLIGESVGKETFETDAHEIMQVIVQLTQKGLEADDPQIESIRLSSAHVAEALGKDFKPYVPALLPGLFKSLSQRPRELDGENMTEDDSDDDEQDMSLVIAGDKVLGLRTTALTEMKDALEQVSKFMKALGAAFCEFLPLTCQNLLPLLDTPLSEDVRIAAYDTWKQLMKCAREGADAGVVQPGDMQQLVTQFLKTTIACMAQDVADSESLSPNALAALQARAAGVAGAIRKAGDGVLSAEVLRDVMAAVASLLDRVATSGDATSAVLAQPEDQSDDSSYEEPDVTRQTVSVKLTDVAVALMKVSPQDFAKDGLPAVAALVTALLKQEASEGERELGLRLIAGAVEHLQEASVPHWDLFMNKAFLCLSDPSASVQRHAAHALGEGARLPAFKPMAAATAAQIYKVLQKRGERHRRRRAVKPEQKLTGLAVDECISSLGLVCEHQEGSLGPDADQAWLLWLSNLPLRYDQDGGKRSHAQLMRLAAGGHRVVGAPAQLPKSLSVLVDVYKTNFSTQDLDAEISRAVLAMSAEQQQQFSSGLSEKLRKKVEAIVEHAKGSELQ